MSFGQADRISDGIVDLINRELKISNDPVQLLAGQLLALRAFLSSAPAAGRPGSFVIMLKTVDLVLQDIVLSSPSSPDRT